MPSSFVNSFIMSLYRFFIAPLGLVLALLLTPFLPKLRATLAMRRRQPEWPTWVGQNPTLWVHCASGEFEYAKAVLREWRQLKPQHKVFVSYFSPSYRKAIEASPEIDFSAPLPLDLPGPMSQFIRKLKPELLAVARTDLWPEMCAQARDMKIPITLFSATRRPMRWWETLFMPIIRWRLQLVDQILAVSATDVEMLNSIGLSKPARALGDSRYDQVLHRLQHPKNLKFAKSESSPVLVVGSSWTEDEEVLIPAVRELLKSKQIRVIVVPHEPTTAHLSELKTRLDHGGLDYQVYSTTEEWTAPVLLIDQIGILAELYTWGDMAMVGGAFKSSVHSVMEPLACGLPTFVGPRHLNNREACEFQQISLFDELGMVIAVKNQEELKTKITKLLAADLPNLKTKIRAAIATKTGAARKIAKTILDSSAG